MNIIINHSSMQPIYEQIVEQIKTRILHGEGKGGDALPSVRTLAKELKISALTVKKAYDYLEEEGFVVTVHGKGSFISADNRSVVEEEWRKEVESIMESAVIKAGKCGMSETELRELFELLLEEYQKSE